MKLRYSVFLATLSLPAVVLGACNDEEVVPFEPQADASDATPSTGVDASKSDVSEPTDASVVSPPFDASPVTIACSGGPCAMQLATTGASTCARLDDGTVRCWGANDNGQLGRGEMDAGQDSLPAPVSGLSSVTQLSAGRDTYCATTSQGEVKCWGSNASGQLGTTDPSVGSSSNVPLTVAGLPPADGVFVGDGIACAVVSGGDVMCWGRGDAGRIPDASFDPLPPTKMDIGGRKARAIAPGAKAIVVLLEDGSLLSWGRRSDVLNFNVTTLGREVSLDPAAPALLPTPPHADLLVGWNNAACAAAGGGAFRWGSLAGIQGPVSPLPVTFASSAKVLDVSLGEGAQFCAVMDNESIRCLGDNTFGQLGTGDFVPTRLVPSVVKDLPAKPARVVTGGFSACAILVTGAVACWGQNSRGQLGTGDYVIHATPTPVRLSP